MGKTKISVYGALAVAVLLSVFISAPAKSTGTAITGTDVEIIYGFTGINGSAAYAAVGFQVWNPTDRYGFGWIVSTTPISDSQLTGLSAGYYPGGLFGRTSNTQIDGSRGFDRMEWNGAPIDFNTSYFYKVGIFDNTGTLVSSESIQIPAITNTGSPSNGLSEMPVFYPAGSVNPYAPGGIFYVPPRVPTVSTPELVGQKIEIDVKFEDPETLNAIQYSTDNGATWLTGDFTATSFGSILGTVNIPKQSSGASLRAGDTYNLRIRGLNDSTAGSGSNASCVVFQSGSLRSCSSPSSSSPSSSTSPSSTSPSSTSPNSPSSSTSPNSPSSSTSPSSTSPNSTSSSSTNPEVDAEDSSIEVATAIGESPEQTGSPVALWIIGFLVLLAIGASVFVIQRKYNFKLELSAKKKAKKK